MAKWKKNVLTIVGVIAVVYLMIYIRVRTEASREFKQAEKYYYYYHHPEEKRKDMLAQLSNREKNQKLEKGQKVPYDIEKFSIEMKEYYYNNPSKLESDLTALVNKNIINKKERDFLKEELSNLKEIFDSDIKTAYYGYKTVLDIWLDPPAWPPSILRNIKLASVTREKLKTVEQEFEAWVNEAKEVSPPTSAKRPISQ